MHEANITGGFDAKISARISEKHLEILDGTIKRLCTTDSRILVFPVLQSALLPVVEKIHKAAVVLHNF